jgi:hypothetical protein
MIHVGDVLVAVLRSLAEARVAATAKLIESLNGIEQAPEGVEAACFEGIWQRFVIPLSSPEARRRILATERGRHETP